MSTCCLAMLCLFKPGASELGQFTPPKWKSPTPLTQEALDRQRAAYWETCSIYGGAREIWQALEAAVSESRRDPHLARTILQSANIRLARSRSLAIAYDELGFEYIIPDYCLSDPENLLAKTKGCGTSRQSPVDHRPFCKALMIKIRFSSHLADLNLTVTGETTFGQLDLLLRKAQAEQQIANREQAVHQNGDSMAAPSQSFDFFYLGKGPFKTSDKVLACMRQSYPLTGRKCGKRESCRFSSDDAVLQAMIRPTGLVAPVQ